MNTASIPPSRPDQKSGELHLPHITHPEELPVVPLVRPASPVSSGKGEQEDDQEVFYIQDQEEDEQDGFDPLDHLSFQVSAIMMGPSPLPSSS
ncbi:MAG TPA: hypothetical protein VKR06_36360 [Ktedonosporobacter sp.]|nr:hypothetical protein [Ktedonosporobacter sp.]